MERHIAVEPDIVYPAFLKMSCPDLSKEEVANACGLDDSHDGANYMRAACVIAGMVDSSQLG